MNKFQSANHILMIEPYEFYSNEETHSSNHYQDRVIESISIETITKNAIEEFTTLKKQIEDRGIKVTSFKGIKGCPDHVFPNWVTTFEDKTMQLFPMMAPNRRLEKAPHMINELSKEYKLYETLFKKTGLTEGKAEIIINTLLESSKKLNRSVLKREKYNLVQGVIL